MMARPQPILEPAVQIDPVEVLGYVASALVVLSLTMSSVLRLRIISLLAAATFIGYGALIGAIPVVITNVGVAVVSIVHLRRLTRDRLRRSYVEAIATRPDEPLVARFLDQHRGEISRFQPDADIAPPTGMTWFIVHEAVPVGLVAAEAIDATTARITCDHVVEAHRDLVPGGVVFGDDGPLAEAGFGTVVATAVTPEHRRYLQRMGFTTHGEEWHRTIG